MAGNNLHFEITGDNKGLMRAVNDSVNGVQNASRQIERSGNDIDAVFGKIGKTIAGVGMTMGLTELTRKVIDVRKEFQSLEVSFSTLLGSDKAGKKMFQDITDFAVKTPMLEKDLAKAAQTMLGFNIEAGKVMPLLQQIGDISMGDSQKFQSLSLAFSQASSTGKLMGQDLLQMINAGFNPLVEMSRTSGKSIKQLKDDMSNGKISVKMLEDAFKSATDEGGKFHDMLLKQSQTMAGAFSNLEGAVQKLYNDIGEKFEAPLVNGVNGVTSSINELAEHLEEIGNIILSVATAYGVYKAACLAVVAVQKALVIWDSVYAFMQMTKWITSAKDAMLLFNMATKASPIGIFAGIIGVVAGGMMMYSNSTESATEKLKKQELEEDRLLQVRKKASDKIAEEQARLENLQKTAENEAISIVKRKSAIDELNKIIPKYNGHIDATTNKYVSSKKALDEYLKSLQKQYELEGAKEEIKKLSQEKIQALVQQKKAKKAVDELVNIDASEEARKDATNRMDAESIDLINKKAFAIGALGMATEKLRKVEEQMASIEEIIDPTPAKSNDASDNKKIKDTTEEYLELIDKSKRERIRAIEDAEFEVRQTQINAEKDKNKALIAQARLDYDKRKKEIERNEQDLILDQAELAKQAWEKDPRNQKAIKGGATWLKSQDRKNFIATISPQEQAMFKAQQEDAKRQLEQSLKEQSDLQEQAMRDYLIKYGEYQEKRLAIEQDYANKIANARTDGEKKSLAKEGEQALRNLDFEQFQKSIKWDEVFGDISKATARQLQKVKKQLKDFTKSPEFKAMKKDEQKAVMDAMNNVEAELQANNPFVAFAESMGEYKTASDELETAQRNLTKAMLIGTDAELKEAKATFENARAQKQLAQAKMAQSLGQAGEQITQITTSIKDMFKSFENINTDEGIGGVFEGIGQSLSGISQTWQSLLKMDIAGIVAGTTNVLVGQIKTIANLGGMLNVLSSADYSGYNKMVQQYEALISVWDTLIDRKTEYIEKSYGAEAVKAGKEAIDLVNKEAEANRKLAYARLNSGASTGSHSIGKRIYKKLGGDDWQDLADALGLNSASQAKSALGGRLEKITELSAEQLRKIQETAPAFWAKLDDDVRKYLEGVISADKQIEEINKQVKEQLTQTSFDTLKSNFISALSDMSKSASDFSEDFEKMLFDAVLNEQVSKMLDTQLTEYYDMFAEYMQGGGVSLSELNEKWNTITSQGTKIRNDVAQATGYNNSDKQSATAKGIQSITEDTANELVGRITAMQIAVEQSKTQAGERMAQAIASIQAMQSVGTAGNAILNDMRTMQAVGNSYLADIAKYNKQMYQDWNNEIKDIRKTLKDKL